MGTTDGVAPHREKNPRGAADAAVQAVAVAVAASIPVALVGLFFAKKVLI
jgi:Na+-driven multidrug efflux pump